jgi:molecular chaperone GrpE
MAEETPGQTESTPVEQREAEPSPAEEIETLRQQFEEEKNKAAETYDQYLRSVAELRNYKKRVEQEREQLAREASAGLLARLLPILDDFDRAMAVLPDEQLRHLSWIEGIALIYRRLHVALEQAGLQPIEAENQPFDPYFHEAILYEEVPVDQDGIVLADLQRGYKLYDRVLRPTLVKVGKAAAPTAEPEEPAENAESAEKEDETGLDGRKSKNLRALRSLRFNLFCP